VALEHHEGIEESLRVAILIVPPAGNPFLSFLISRKHQNDLFPFENTILYSSDCTTMDFSKRGTLGIPSGLLDRSMDALAHTWTDTGSGPGFPDPRECPSRHRKPAPVHV